MKILKSCTQPLKELVKYPDEVCDRTTRASSRGDCYVNYSKSKYERNRFSIKEECYLYSLSQIQSQSAVKDAVIIAFTNNSIHSGHKYVLMNENRIKYNGVIEQLS